MTAKDDKKSGTKDPWTSNLGKIGLQRYTVEEIAVRDVHLKIQAVHDLNIEEAHHILTGQRIWSAAKVLTLYLAEHPDVVDFAGSVLELGAGPGLPGLAAAQICRKAEKVVMSDNKDLVLKLLRKNIDKNFPKERARFQCAHLQWGDDVTSFRAKHGRFDVILGADLAYFRPDIPLLIETAKELLTEKPSAVFVLAYKDRTRKKTHNFEWEIYQAAKRCGLQWNEVDWRALPKWDEMVDPCDVKNLHLLLIKHRAT
ncbi:protein N-lysine methyltransferase METTL21A-like isoform X1 [Branchiostoma floridae]|uniref:Protein N-lysine methyltransferase METTL21A-like isoform X1 n=1 Tax=Branchiostoma floridae TaxID=7739 RepID=A0A9J7MUR9_BRAFL|nr:protein N-lysine methyltransferase METTL21A-like isoform X1 [Branchiostoma floridae]